MSLTRAEEEFIKILEDTNRDDQERENFLDHLIHSVKNGSRASDAGSRINWGSAAFGKEFVERVIAEGNITDAALFKISEALLDNHTFDQAPLRQVHLFSHLYAELLKRYASDILAEPPSIPMNLHTINRKILLQNISIFNKKSGQDATYDCINNFLYMRFDDLHIPQEKRGGIQQLFFDNVKSHVDENNRVLLIQARTEKFHKKPNTPLPQRKAKEGTPEKIAEEFDRQSTKMLQPASGLRKASFFKSKSDKPSADEKKAQPPRKAKSSPPK